MLERPAISDATISACLYDSFGLCITQIMFLPIGWVNNAVYRVAADDGTSYFLKLRRGSFDEIAVTVPAFLHANAIARVMAPIATVAQDLWVHMHGFDWILYPFFNGTTGFEVALSKPQWIALGESMNAVHATRLPAALAARDPTKSFRPVGAKVSRSFTNT
jgi:spectinomycin phosphotransferase